MSSTPLFALILFEKSIVTLQRIRDNLMRFLLLQDTKPPLNHGELVEPSLVFPVLQEVVLTVQVRVLLETCVEEAECLLQPKHTEDGTER
jgi:hypothetical protein